MDKKLLEKIQKLLSLANSDNEHEAKLAMDLANELLVKHNISMQTATESLEYERTVLSEDARACVEDKFVNDILKKHFFVKIVKSRGRVNHTTTTVTYILGTDTNVQIATYVHGYLKATFKSLFKAYKKETGCKANARQSYYFGLLDGISSQFEKTKKKVEQKEGLVVVEDKKLKSFLMTAFPRLKTRTQGVPNRDQDATQAGIEHGKEVRISRGISSNGQGGLYLGGK